MKIGLITIHWANNYGAALQVYANYKVLGRYGDVIVIDYRNNYTSKGMQLVRVGRTARDVLRAGKDILRIFPRYRVISKFKKFNNDHMRFSSLMCCQKDFDELDKRMDIFVSGSDQIWNPQIVSENEQLDGRYFLDFVKSGRKISYASSMGTYQFKGKKQDELFSLLSRYDSISVREKNTALYISSTFELSAEHVVDPTLLLSRDEWFHEFPNIKNKEEKYVLIYALKKDKLLKEVVSYISKLLGIKVYAIDQDPLLNYTCDKHFMDRGPEEFLQLFNNAEFIITNSFHGTAFAVNFNIPFIVTTPPTGINRIESLLLELGLTDRMISNFNTEALSEIVKHNIDFDVVNMRLNQLRLRSLNYLQRALHGSV